MFRVNHEHSYENLNYRLTNTLPSSIFLIGNKEKGIGASTTHYFHRIVRKSLWVVKYFENQ